MRHVWPCRWRPLSLRDTGRGADALLTCRLRRSRLSLTAPPGPGASLPCLSLREREMDSERGQTETSARLGAGRPSGTPGPRPADAAGGVSVVCEPRRPPRQERASGLCLCHPVPDVAGFLTFTRCSVATRLSRGLSRETQAHGDMRSPTVLKATGSGSPLPAAKEDAVGPGFVLSRNLPPGRIFGSTVTSQQGFSEGWDTGNPTEGHPRAHPGLAGTRGSHPQWEASALMSLGSVI